MSQQEKQEVPAINRLGFCSVMTYRHTPREAMALALDAGADGIEWRVTDQGAGHGTSLFGDNRCTLAPHEVPRAVQECRDSGLEVIGLDTYVDTGDLAAAEAAAAVAADAGVDWFRFRAPWRDGTPWAVHADAARRFVDDLAVIAARRGVRALLEIHQRTVCPSASLAERIVGHADPQLVGVIYDVGNLLVEGFEEHRLAVEILGAHLAHVHVKNARYVRHADGGAWVPQWSPLDDGLLDLAALRAALDDAGYDGWLSLEDFSSDHTPEDTLRAGLDVLRTGNRSGALR